MSLPLAPIKRVMKEVAPNMAISAETVEYMAGLVEGYIEANTVQAAKNSIHAGRKTIQFDDLDLAVDAE